MKRDTLKERIVMLCILVAVPILYFTFETIIPFDISSIDHALFIMATFIVTMTIYYSLSILLIKKPQIMTKGIWQNVLLVIIFGFISLITLMFALIFLVNHMDASTAFYRILIYCFAYPIVFILIIMIDAFLSKIVIMEHQKRLFYSSISISICLTIMILSTLLQNNI